MSQTFYRVHWTDCPPLTPDNAWSALWGSTRSEDGTQTECRQCDGTGEFDRESCPNCNGEGWHDCVPGYSATTTALGLVEYFDGPDGLEGDEPVVIFEGRQVSYGIEGEPTVIPERILETLTWADFVARAAELDAAEERTAR